MTSSPKILKSETLHNLITPAKDLEERIKECIEKKTKTKSYISTIMAETRAIMFNHRRLLDDQHSKNQVTEVMEEWDVINEETTISKPKETMGAIKALYSKYIKDLLEIHEKENKDSKAILAAATMAIYDEDESMSDDGKKMFDNRDQNSIDEETKNDSDAERLAIDIQSTDDEGTCEKVDVYENIFIDGYFYRLPASLIPQQFKYSPNTEEKRSFKSSANRKSAKKQKRSYFIGNFFSIEKTQTLTLNRYQLRLGEIATYFSFKYTYSTIKSSLVFVIHFFVCL